MERRTKKKPFKKSEGKGKDKDLFPREFKKRVCRFCQEKGPANPINYKDLNRVVKFLSDRGRMLSRRLTGNCARHQRRVAEAIRRARFLALLP